MKLTTTHKHGVILHSFLRKTSRGVLSLFLSLNILLIFTSLLLVGGISFFGIGLSENPLYIGLLALSRNPFSASPHLALARIYFKLGYLDKSAAEVVLNKELAERSVTEVDVLGETANASQLENEIAYIPRAQNEAETYWKSLLQRHPTYRDGWIQLLYQSVNSGKIENEAVYLEKALQIDPNVRSELNFPTTLP